MNWRLQVKIRAFENINKITTVIVGSGTLAMVGTIVAEFIAANAGIGHSRLEAKPTGAWRQTHRSPHCLGLFLACPPVGRW